MVLACKRVRIALHREARRYERALVRMRDTLRRARISTAQHSAAHTNLKWHEYAWNEWSVRAGSNSFAHWPVRARPDKGLMRAAKLSTNDRPIGQFISIARCWSSRSFVCVCVSPPLTDRLTDLVADWLNLRMNVFTRLNSSRWIYIRIKASQLHSQ